MTLVIDANVVAAGLLPDESDASLADLAALDSDLCVPSLLAVEVWNLLLMAERRGRIGMAESDLLLSSLESVQFRIDGQPDAQSTMTLARRHGLTAYDALYLELAIREGATLATLDRKLVAAANAEGVRLA